MSFIISVYSRDAFKEYLFPSYYVKIRAYKKVGKTKYYGEWSKVKKVKIK